MKNNILVSIIVPVFNSEKYIIECINSLINQTYQNIEVIVVDDGSTDRSLALLNSLNNSKIKVIKQTNMGANIARMRGVEAASGEFIMFVDSDDYISLYTVEKLVNYLSNSKADVVHFKQTNEKFDLSDDNCKMISNFDIKNILISSKNFNSLCSAIYKKSLFNNLESFSYKISYAEDYLVNLEVLSKVNSMLIINKKLYYCRAHNQSTTRTQDLNRVLKNFDELILVYGKLFDYLTIWNMNDSINRKRVSSLILDVTRMFIYNLLRINNLTKMQFIAIMNKYLSNDLYDIVRAELNISEIDKNILYKIKNIYTLKNILNKKYKKIWKIRYFLKLKDLIWS